MTQQELQTPISLCGKLTNALFEASAGDENNLVGILDDAIPLHGTSHADVVEYVVEIPMRYAECLAVLSDGRTVGLKDPRKFVGWSRHGSDRSLLFRSNGKHFEVAVEGRLRGQTCGSIRELHLESKSERRSSVARKFIGVDGDMVVLPELPATV